MATPRTLWRAILDRCMAWAVGLPPETCGYTVTPVQIPLRDGAVLAGDLYMPAPAPAAGTDTGAPPAAQLLVQGPYGRGARFSVVDASVWAARGYQVLLVSCRGVFGSTGRFDPGRTEAADARDVVAWMRAQPWYPGAFATAGASFLGYTQWALLRDPPPDLRAACVAVGPHDLARQHWGAGAYRLDRVGWADMVSVQEDAGLGPLARVIRMLTTRSRLAPVYRDLPLLESVKRHLDGKAPWQIEAMANPDIEDEWWAPMRHAVALEKVAVPVMLNSGWHDMFFLQTMEQYAGLRKRGCNVELTIGPWTHLDATGIKVMPRIFDWMEAHVAGRVKKHVENPVRVFVTGAKEWREMRSWPPETTTETFYLQPHDGLSRMKPGDDTESSGFTYDPEDPTPTLGGALMAGGGSVDDRSLAARSDVLTFTTETLPQDVEVMGKPTVILAHTSDTPHVDLFVRLGEVDAKGTSRNITEMFKRLDPCRASEPIKLSLADCGHRFKRGTRIRLLIAGGCFPMYARNTGTDESLMTAVALKSATHTITHAGGLSSLHLPVSVVECGQ